MFMNLLGFEVHVVVLTSVPFYLGVVIELT
jgi:hypothetical protein